MHSFTVFHCNAGDLQKWPCNLDLPDIWSRATFAIATSMLYTGANYNIKLEIWCWCSQGSLKTKSLNRKHVQQISTRSDIMQEMAMNRSKLHKASIIVYIDLKISIPLIVIPDQYLYNVNCKTALPTLLNDNYVKEPCTKTHYLVVYLYGCWDADLVSCTKCTPSLSVGCESRQFFTSWITCQWPKASPLVYTGLLTSDNLMRIVAWGMILCNLILRSLPNGLGARLASMVRVDPL